MTVLFGNLLEINWFMVTYFYDKVLSTPMSLLTGKDWFAVRNICDKSFANHKPREKFLAHKKKLVFSICLTVKTTYIITLYTVMSIF